MCAHAPAPFLCTTGLEHVPEACTNLQDYSCVRHVWLHAAGILYAKYKSEKLMEHLKLFAARLNIPRLIRVCEEQQHWKELVFLYIAYDEYDNAALVMMAHSPVAWEHVQFKDVAVKVSITVPAWE